jgi:DNA gyrase/topoisomerase IV subunit B
LINSATGYDKRSDKPNPTGKPRRLVFQSETLFGDNTDIDDDVILEDESFEFKYDVDTTQAELQAYVMNRRERPQFKSGSRIPITRWKALSEKAKQIWDTIMEDNDKALILVLQENRKDASKPDQSKYAVKVGPTVQSFKCF